MFGASSENSAKYRQFTWSVSAPFRFQTAPGRQDTGDSADGSDSSDSDGGQRPFFDRDIHLTVSGQLHLEAITW